MSNPTVIELQGLEVRFGGRPILKGLNASLSGRCIGLLGPNGAGKTTLLHTLLGFHPPSVGTARIFGKDIQTHAREIRGQMGYMPENDAFISGMTAVRFVRLMGEISGLPSERSLERAHEALFYVGLGEARYRKVETYSLGMKQLAKLAQALVHGPRLIFLDEPTNGLDPDARERMLRLIHDIRDTGEVNIILSSHLLRDVEECCDEVLVLKGGTIATYCNLEEERRGNRRFLELETRGGDDRVVHRRRRGPGGRDGDGGQDQGQARAAGRDRGSRPLQAGGGAPGADPPSRLQEGLLAGHLPQGDGDGGRRPWPCMSATTGGTRGN